MRRLSALLPMLVMLGCTSSEEIKPAVTTSTRSPIVLAVADVQIESRALPPAEGTFKDKRRSERLVEAARDFLKGRLMAGGGQGLLVATVTQATIIERPRATIGGIKGALTSEPDANFDANVAVRLSVIDELGLEKAGAEIKVGRTRAVPEGLDVIERDVAAEAVISDLLRQLDDKLTETVETDLSAFKAF